MHESTIHPRHLCEMPMHFLFPPPEPVNWALLLVAVAVQAATLSLLLRLERESIRQRSSSEADMNATAPAGGPGGLPIRALVLSGLSLFALFPRFGSALSTRIGTPPSSRGWLSWLGQSGGSSAPVGPRDIA